MTLAHKARCVLMGDQSLLIQCAEILHRRDHVVVAVITGSAPIAAWAEKLGLAVVGSGGNLDEAVSQLEYDWFFSIANLRLVPGAVWRRAAQGAANFHDGPLPRYAGLNAPTWAILNGETCYGVTWHALAEKVDAGDIYARRTFDLAPDETAFTLNSRCFEAGMASFAELVSAIEDGTLRRRPQDSRERSYFEKRRRPEAAGLLRFDQPSEGLLRLARALDFGPGYANPLVTLKAWTGRGIVRVGSLSRASHPPSTTPGLVISADGSGATITTADGAVRLERLFDGNGEEVQASSVFRPGHQVPILDAAEATRITVATEDVARHESFFSDRLSTLRPLDLPDIKPLASVVSASLASIVSTMPGGLGGDRRIAALAACLARLSGEDVFDVAYADDASDSLAKAFPGLVSPSAPLRVATDRTTTVAAVERAVSAELGELRRRGGYLADLVDRQPTLRRPRFAVGIALAARPGLERAIDGCAVTFVLPREGGELLVLHDETRLPEPEARGLLHRLRIALDAFATCPDTPIDDLPLMTEGERELVIEGWNRTERRVDLTACVHELVERQADLTPDAIALAFGDEAITFEEVERRSNQVAHALAEAGVGPEALVGLYAGRSLDLVVGALGIQKAGGAYVPLDPAYPADRLAFMIEDSGLDVVLTQRALASALPGKPRRVVCVEDACAGGRPAGRPRSGVTPDHLAYVIYTSGSTGRPKGVMVEHRQVVNFFAGMDERVAWRDGADPVWLALTSLSFDISVLELFWTLARGIKTVIGSATPSGGARPPAPATAGRVQETGFGLFFWGNDDGPGPRKYQLLLEGARFADSHGFSAVWTPERHFHAFGGPYPNPAVTGAAVAAVTRNVSIRAGSCVLPLHHPARVAEEWAVIDNISGGRVALAFASGWMPEDFVLRPENAPPRNKAALTRDIDVVRRLWRGEPVAFERPDGAALEVVTQPRPVQKELPIWVTTAGNLDTYREAARLGANVLTHLLGQSIDELAGKIEVYRAALAEAGRNPADGKVTLMLHTLLGDDREEVRELARGPMKDYLRSAAALIKQYAWAFPAFKKPAGVADAMQIDLQSLDGDEMDAILEFAFLRYFEDSGLFGTVEDAIERVGQLRAIGVDEIACLIDFGVESEVALARLEPLAAVVRQVNRPADAYVDDGGEDHGVAAQIRRHRVTHLQCTPSMARMMLSDPDDRRALGDLRHVYLGGEALPGALVADLRRATSATIENMYGPTETTIWSATGAAEPCPGVVPLGRPIVNTQLYALDDLGRPVPPRCAGELYIGGDGVARGYHNRPDLTAAKFLANPFVPGGRIYRTGDLVSFSSDGTLNFLGRVDHQVKVRGHRIELGEIEEQIRTYPGVRDAVVAVREDRPGDARIVAYLLAGGAPVDADDLRRHLARALPDIMVPARYVTLERFPLTPNAKVDRKALPQPDDVLALAAANDHVAPIDDVQRQIAETFKRILGVARVGLSDNFFSLGGHSLLAVQAHRELKATVAPALTITDLFRFQTVGELARHVADRKGAGGTLGLVADRAAARRAALGARGVSLRRTREAV